MHKNESGQSIVFSAITFLFLAMFVFMVLNVGDVTQRKMRLTNNADAVAISGATWMCRGYNLTAMLNITQTQVLAIIILLKSVKTTDEIADGLLKAQHAVASALTGFPLTAAVGAFLEALTTAEDVAMTTIKSVYESLADSLEDNGNGVLWDVEDALVTAEEIEVKAIPFIAQIEAVKTGLANGATIGVLYPLIPLVDLKLPFIDDDERKFQSLCKPVADHFNAISRAVDTKIAKVGNIGMNGQKNIEHMPTTSFLGTSEISDTLGAFMNVLTAGDFGPAPLEYFKAFFPYPLLRLLPPFIGAVFDVVVRANYMAMCTNSPGSYSYKNTSNECSDCKNNADKLTKINYGIIVGLTVRKDEVNSIDDMLTKKQCNCGDPSPCKVVGQITDKNGNSQDVCAYMEPVVAGKDVWLEGQSSAGVLEGDNAKTFFKVIMGKKCFIRKVSYKWVYPDQYGLSVDENELRYDGKVKVKIIKEYKVSGCEYEETGHISQDQAWGSRGGSGDDDKPRPYLLNREDDDGKEYWQTHKDYVGIVYELPKDNIVKIKAGLDNPNPIGVIYFSQAEIYVPDGVEPHLFNQCWQVRLVRFTKFKELSEKLDSNGVNQALSAADSSGSGSVGKFMKLFKSLKEIFSGDVIIH